MVYWQKRKCDNSNIVRDEPRNLSLWPIKFLKFILPVSLNTILFFLDYIQVTAINLSVDHHSYIFEDATGEVH